MTSSDHDSPTSTLTPDNPAAPPNRLFTFSSGGWVLLLAVLCTFLAAALVLYPVYLNGFHPPVGDGRNVDTYGFDLSRLLIPRDQLVASGGPKDGIDAIAPTLVETITPEAVDLIPKNEHIRFLVPSDLVIGLQINGESRAYPARVLVLHELVNDTLGGTPLAVTWTPLCGAAVVFDRRIDGPQAPPAEFGVSGLLLQSNSIFFDRRKDPKNESLWPQLAFHAISGPAAGKQLTLLPYQLTTWQAWRTEHPDTRVLLGLRRRKAEYGSEPYSIYLHNNDLKFPVSPRFPNAHIPNKTPLLLTSSNARQWTATFDGNSPGNASSASSTQSGPHYELHAFLFAWYAQHEKDTDYSALK
jgi:hypothetical protein